MYRGTVIVKYCEKCVKIQQMRTCNRESIVILSPYIRLMDHKIQKKKKKTINIEVHNIQMRYKNPILRSNTYIWNKDLRWWVKHNTNYILYFVVVVFVENYNFQVKFLLLSPLLLEDRPLLLEEFPVFLEKLIYYDFIREEFTKM